MLFYGLFLGSILGGAIALLCFRAASGSRDFVQELEQRRAELDFAHRERVLEHERKFHASERRRSEEPIDERRQRLQRRRAQLVLAEARMEARGDAYDRAKAGVVDRSRALRHQQQERIRRLEIRADASAEACRREWCAVVVARAKKRLEARLSADAEKLHMELQGRARNSLSYAVNRYDGVSHLERVSSVFGFDENLAPVYCADGSAAAALFQEATGCEILPQPDGSSVSIRSDDPLARELACRVLRVVIKRDIDSLPALRALIDETRMNLDAEVKNAGAKAVNELKLKSVAPEIQNLLGRLKFRLSFSQNQWKHSIEVAHLAGLLARELGLPMVPARRAGLMHDMGKALSHERDEGHAVVGAEYAERGGETEEVRHAIGAHHYDETPSTALAFLIIAADAMSGARPGARRETSTQYAQRVRKIEAIARRERSVARVDVVQGGREVRVTVAGEETGLDENEKMFGTTPALPDDEIQPTATRIAAAIADELNFAGQIRVTVIRESRAASVAR